jgi:conjugal transfer pilus assembly protein TraA
MGAIKKLSSVKMPRVAFVATLMLLTAMIPEAMAGTGGTEFDAIYTLLVGWTQGTLGKIIALTMFLVGLSGGIIRQSIAAVVVGVGGALALFYGPTVIGGVVSAVI